MARFKAIGLTDVHEDPIDLAPQWFPQSWEVTASGGGKTLKLDTVQPSYNSTGTTGAGLDLDVVYAGLGSEADFIGRDVRGKAVLLFSNPMPGSWRHTATQEGAIARAQQKGAAAIIVSIQLPHVVGMTGECRRREHPHAALSDRHERADLLDGNEGRHRLPRDDRRRRPPASRCA